VRIYQSEGVYRTLHRACVPASTGLSRGCVFVLLAAVIANVVSLGALAFVHITVYVNDREVHLPFGARVAQALAAAGVELAAGDLIDADGAVLEVGSGNPAQLTLNGARCDTTDRVAPGDRIEVTQGVPIIESIVVETVETAQPFEVVGSGSFVKVRSPGAPGKVTVKKGLITGKVFESAKSQEPSAMVIARFQYAVAKKLVVLSFDDGPHPVYTPQILEVLRDEGVHAVFFVVGAQVASYPGILKRIYAEGHEIGNHTYSHTLTESAPESDVLREINDTSELVEKLTGGPTRWVRPVGGALSASFVHAAEASGHTVVLWNVDTQDWRAARGSGRSDEIRLIVADAPPASGSVILMHDGGGYRGATVQALKAIIPYLREQGYEFCTLSELWHFLGLDT
jgi:peptidoglycan/xylan/chitin deacetylase (PgdA/CDA1 family)